MRPYLPNGRTINQREATAVVQQLAEVVEEPRRADPGVTTACLGILEQYLSEHGLLTKAS